MNQFVLDDLPEWVMLTSASQKKLKLTYEESEKVADFIRAMDDSIRLERRLEWALAAEGYAVDEAIARAKSLVRLREKLLEQYRTPGRSIKLATIALLWLHFDPRTVSFGTGVEWARSLFGIEPGDLSDEKDLDFVREQLLKAVSDSATEHNQPLESPSEVLKLVAEHRLALQ